MPNPYITPNGSVFQFPTQESQSGPSESFARSFRDMDYDAIAGMTPSHMYVREENLFNESVHEVTVGDPNPPPRLGRRLLRRHVDEAARPSPAFSRPHSSSSGGAGSWRRTHRHAGHATAEHSLPRSYASDVPTQMFEEIQLSRDMRASDLSAEERWNIFEDMSSVNATDRDWPYTAQSQQETSFRNRYKAEPSPMGFPSEGHTYPDVPSTQQKQQSPEYIQLSHPATNWRSRSQPPRRRRPTFRYRPGPVTQPRRLFDGDSSSEIDDFTNAPCGVAPCGVGPPPGAEGRVPPAYASPAPGPSGLQPPPFHLPPRVSPDSSLWSASQTSVPAPPPPPPPPAPYRGKGKAIPGKPLQAKRGRPQPPTTVQLTDGLPFIYPTESRPCTAPSMFLRQDWSTSCLPDNYYTTYCGGPVPRIYN